MRDVLVDHNDLVEVGQPLARLDTAKLDAQAAHTRATLAARLARVAEAEATLREATDQYERVNALADRNVSTVQARDAAIATLRRAEALVAVARADADVVRADLLLDETNRAKAFITSPIRGVVLERNVEPGQIVASSFNTPILFTIAEDLAQMELRVDVDEADMGAVRVGQSARFVVEAHQGRSFPAAISELRYAPKTIDGVVTYEALLTIDNADLLLRPGMTATAEIIVAQIDDALLVPNATLRFAPPAAAAETRSSGGLLGLLIPRRPGAAAPTAVPKADPDGWRTVWIARDGAPTAVRVQTGASDGLRTEILDGPLAPGEPVITDMARP
jgi:HlyD family secretion protein